jgi:hypothetical protein
MGYGMPFQVSLTQVPETGTVTPLGQSPAAPGAFAHESESPASHATSSGLRAVDPGGAPKKTVTRISRDSESEALQGFFQVLVHPGLALRL